MTIRPATDGDWPRIWPIFEATVQAGETYAFPMDLTGKRHHPWMGAVSLRWVLIHMIEEYARHNGHADLLRERIDGRLGQ